MEERGLTGNKMFEMVKKECERSLGKVVIEKKEKGILFRDTPYSKFVEGGKKWFKTGNRHTHVRYEGEIENRVPNGQGKESSPYGDKYEGEFKNGLRYGNGTLYFSGNTYEGRWKNGKKNGYGTFTSPMGLKYLGKWKDNKYHGHGKLSSPDFGKYIGIFKDGKYHEGTFIYPDESRYVGEYKDNKFWNGTSFDKNGNIRYKYVNGEEIKQ